MEGTAHRATQWDNHGRRGTIWWMLNVQRTGLGGAGAARILLDAVRSLEVALGTKVRRAPAEDGGGATAKVALVRTAANIKTVRDKKGQQK